jgi:hypothetical protein
MNTDDEWKPFEGTPGEMLEAFPNPLMALVEGKAAALVFRKVFPASHCEELLERFYDQGLLFDPREQGREFDRVDIGTSLGRYNKDRQKLFEHASGTHELFRHIFDGYEDPVKTIYSHLSALVPSKQVMVAREPDGSLYGPSIFRTYYEGVGHKPHFDSASKREKLFEYQASRFSHQFSAVLCFQNSEVQGECGEPFLYRCPWNPKIQKHLDDQIFHDYALDNNIPKLQVELEPGDLYVFFTENIHEVPEVAGDRPRIVLASFFAMSPDDPEIYVWS